MKDDGHYTCQWPKDGLFTECFVHEILNFRYHWHPEDYELSILLNGKQYFCRGKESFLLEAGDMILVDPNEGHASCAQSPDTVAFVLHFSSAVMNQLTAKNTMLSYSGCITNTETRNEPRCRAVRAAAAKLVLAMAGGSAADRFAAKAYTELLISLLNDYFDPDVIYAVPEVDEEVRKILTVIAKHIEKNYAEKITLEDIAAITQYNRTYISTLFHKSTGISFYDYLMRVRLQHAINDLVITDRSLTDIALSNGFADLKSFNSRFRELLNCLPSEYRKQQKASGTGFLEHGRKYLPVSDPFVQEKLNSWIRECLTL